LTRIASDRALRRELASHEFSAVALARLAARYGYEFSPQELLARVYPLADDTWEAAARTFDRHAQSDHPETYVLFLEEVPMSKEAISAFFKKAAEDPALQKKLVELAAAEGFDFSIDELSDVDLDSVAGGAIYVKREDPISNIAFKSEPTPIKPIIREGP